MMTMSKTKRPESNGVTRLRCIRHDLMLPPPEEALAESPTWVRERKSTSFEDSPVTLVMALEEEPSTAETTHDTGHGSPLERGEYRYG